METKREPKSALLYREGTYDLEVIREVWNCYSHLGIIGPEDVVLDLGGNIGAFVALVAHGAKQVITVEPEPDNFSLLKQNVGMLENVVAINAACVADDTKEVQLFLNGSKNKGSHSLIVQGGRDPISVPAVNFAEILAKYKPNIIKMDIEGSEYPLLLNTPLPDCVKRLAVEFHYSRKDYKAWLPQVREKLDDQFFSEVVPFTITEAAWHKIGFYAR